MPFFFVVFLWFFYLNRFSIVVFITYLKVVYLFGNIVNIILTVISNTVFLHQWGFCICAVLLTPGYETMEYKRGLKFKSDKSDVFSN